MRGTGDGGEIESKTGREHDSLLKQLNRPGPIAGSQTQSGQRGASATTAGSEPETVANFLEPEPKHHRDGPSPLKQLFRNTLAVRPQISEMISARKICLRHHAAAASDPGGPRTDEHSTVHSQKSSLHMAPTHGHLIRNLQRSVASFCWNPSMQPVNQIARFWSTCNKGRIWFLRCSRSRVAPIGCHGLSRSLADKRLEAG